MLIIHNTQLPESTLKKKSNYIYYHTVRDSVAIGESLTGHVSTNKNCAGLDQQSVGKTAECFIGFNVRKSWGDCENSVVFR